MQLNKKIVLGGSVLLAAVAAFVVYRQITPVAVVGKVSRGTAVQAVPANVIVTESFRMELKSEQGGRIIHSNVRLGGEVKAGDLLYEIDPRDLELEIERIELDYKATKARIELGSALRFQIATAEENVRNNTRLVDQGSLAKVELDRAKRAVDQLKDQLANEEITNQQTLEGFENTLKSKRRQLEKMRITAPEDGTISEIFARNGDLVGGGSVLARLISRERLVKAQISEENFAGIRPGLSANLQFLGYGAKVFPATVERILPNADELTKRYIAFLKTEIPVEQLVPGLTGEASITMDRHENVLVAERRSFIGHSVLAVRNGRVRVIPVVIGFSGLNVTEIISGVEEGDEIIVEDVNSFREGERVRTVQKAE